MHQCDFESDLLDIFLHWEMQINLINKAFLTNNNPGVFKDDGNLVNVSVAFASESVHTHHDFQVWKKTETICVVSKG